MKTNIFPQKLALTLREKMWNLNVNLLNCPEGITVDYVKDF